MIERESITTGVAGECSNLGGRAVERDLTPHNRRVRTEAPLPQPVAQHGGPRRRGRIELLFLSEGAAEQWSGGQSGEDARRGAREGDLFEDAVIAPPVEVIGWACAGRKVF